MRSELAADWHTVKVCEREEFTYLSIRVLGLHAPRLTK